MPAHFLCALGDILNGHTFTGVGGVVVAGFRNFNDSDELVVDHNALGAVLAGTLRFVHIDMVDQFPEKWCGQLICITVYTNDRFFRFSRC